MSPSPDTRIRVLYSIPNFITAGSGGAMLNIASRLDPERFEPSFVVLQRGGKLEARIEASGWSLYEVPYCFRAKPRPTLPWRAWRLARRLPWPTPHVWHSFHYADDYTEPLVARLSGARGWIYTKKNMNWHARSWLVRTRLAHRVVAQNTDMLTSFFDSPRFAAKTVRIPRGVDAERFRPDVEPQLGVRRQLGIDASTPLLGCVGQLLPVKGHDVLIRAMPRLEGAHLAIAGAGDDTTMGRSLQALAGELGVSDRVHLLGPVRDVPAFLTELDVFVHPTLGRGRMEGCPVAVLEAMAAGRAIVATDIPGTRDLIVSDESGILVPPEDVDALDAAIRPLLASADARASFGDGARSRVLDSFTIQHEVAAHAALYEEIATAQGWSGA